MVDKSKSSPPTGPTNDKSDHNSSDSSDDETNPADNNDRDVRRDPDYKGRATLGNNNRRITRATKDPDAPHCSLLINPQNWASLVTNVQVLFLLGTNKYGPVPFAIIMFTSHCLNSKGGKETAGMSSNPRQKALMISNLFKHITVTDRLQKSKHQKVKNCQSKLRTSSFSEFCEPSWETSWQANLCIKL